MKNSPLALAALILSISSIAQISPAAKARVTESQKKSLIEISEQQGARFASELILIEEAVASERIRIDIDLGENAHSQIKSISTGVPIYYITDNANAAISIGADKLHTGGVLGLNLNGQGMVIGEWDGGATLTSHQEFGSRATQNDNASALSNHATHVAGTMIASGMQVSARGMAPQASLLAHDWTNDNAEMATAASNGLLLSNHSYGVIGGWAYGPWATGSNAWHWFGDPLISSTQDYKFGYYSYSAKVWDDVANNAPYYLIVKSAGNDRGESHSGGHYVWQSGSWNYSTSARNSDGNSTGYDCISGEGVSKNVLTIGAVDDVLNYTGASSVVMSTFSGWGPTDDGRIKPDLVANGVMLYSSMSSGMNAYGSMSGTSMSGPSATGGLSLIQQHVYAITGSYLKSSTLKGLAIHTAKEAGVYPGPDYQFGWGLLDVEKAVEVVSDSNSVMMVQTLANATSYTTSHTVSSNPVKITIAWNDPAGTSVTTNLLNNTTSMLVNDLDVTLTSPSGQVYQPYVLNPNNPSFAATTGDNVRDNVEVINLPSGASPGEYTITVSHKGTLVNNTQEFSIIITGVTAIVAPISCQFLPKIEGSKTIICSPGDSVLLYEVNISDTSAGKNLLWSSGASSDSIWVTPMQSTMYWLQNSYQGTTCADSITIVLQPAPSAFITSMITSDNSQTSITLTSSSGQAYLWSDSSTTNSISVYPDSTTTYTVLVTDANGCSSDASFVVATSPVTFILDLSSQSVNQQKGVHISGNFQNWQPHSTPMSYNAVLNAWTFTREFIADDTVTYKFINGDSWSDAHDMLLNGCGVGLNGDRWFVTSAQLDTLGPYHLSSCDEAPPIDPLSNEVVVCQADTAELSVSNLLSNVQWSSGDTTNSIYALNQGLYWMTGEYPNGVVINDTTEVVHLPIPSSTITTSGNTQLCPGDNVSLTSDTSFVSSWVWFPTQDTGSTINTQLGGQYFAYWTTNDGCQGYSDTVVVSNLTSPSQMISISDSNYFCLGDTLTLSAEPGHSYMWSTGDLDSAIQVFSSGSYWVDITGQNGCGSMSDTITTVMLNGVALPVLLIGNSFAANGDTTNIKMIPYNPSYTYQWSVIGGSIIQGPAADNIDIIWQSAPGDTAMVQLIVDNGVCHDSTESKIYITLVGFDENPLGIIYISPNPASQVLTIHSNLDAQNLSYFIYNKLGQVIQSGKVDVHGNIDIASIPNGPYFLSILKEETTSHMRFIKVE